MMQGELNMTTLPRELDLLIVPRWIVPVVPHGQVLENHALAVHQGRIVGIVPVASANALNPRERRDLPDHVLIPGLINAHGHAAMTLFRGLAPRLDAPAAFSLKLARLWYSVRERDATLLEELEHG